MASTSRANELVATQDKHDNATTNTTKARKATTKKINAKKTAAVTKTTALEAKIAELEGMSHYIGFPVLTFTPTAQVRKEAAARKALEDREARTNMNQSAPEAIIAIPKPKGEAGDGKRGYMLIEAMGLNGDDEEDEELYASILVSWKRSTSRVSVCLGCHQR